MNNTSGKLAQVHHKAHCGPFQHPGTMKKLVIDLKVTLLPCPHCWKRDAELIR